ncbi:MAG: winged helix-turn-helix domain-containing protein [Gemmatimonadota bacterium]
MAERDAAARRIDPPGSDPDLVDAADGGAPADALALDSLFHERVRLGIVSALAGHERMAFTDLRDSLGLTDGNLSAHTRKLENAGYLACHKSFVGRTPHTEYELTPLGRIELTRYLDHLEAIIRTARDDGGSR